MLKNEFLELLKQPPDKRMLLLTRSMLANMITQYLDGKLSASNLVELSNLLELSDNVVYEADHEQTIADALFALSSPEINNNLTFQELKRLRNELIKS